MSISGPSKAITVHLARSTVLPGEVLEGEVYLHFPAVLDDKYKEVHIKLRGSMNVEIIQKTDRFTNTKTEHNVELLRDKQKIWTRGTYPPPDSHVLKVPFQFSLPQALLPPTCKHRANSKGNNQEIAGEVSYHLEIVGSRGTLHSTKRERTTFRVLPPFARGAQLHSELTPSWTGDWRTVTRHINVPVGRGKRVSRIEMQFKFPAIEAIPSSAHIPFTLRIVSSSPRISWDETSETEFIEPPTKPLDIDFRLERILRIQPEGHQVPLATATNTILRLGGVGLGQVVRNGRPVTTQVSERHWVPELHDASYGSWKQETTFSSRFRIACPTTLVTELMRVEYRLYIRVGLAIKSKTLECQIPVTVIAGNDVPDTPSLEEARPVPECPVDSPPDYFDEFGGLGRHRSGTATLPSPFRETDVELQERFARMTVGPLTWPYQV